MTEQASVFDRLLPTARSHFVLHFFAAVYRIVYHLRRLHEEKPEAIFAEHSFLSSYFGEMVDYLPPGLSWQAGTVWWRDQIARWEQQAAVHLPLLALHRLDFDHRLALVLAGLVEEDSRFGSIFEQLQAPLLRRRPSLEMIAYLLADDHAPARPDPWHLGRVLIGAGLAVVDDEQAPRSEWLLRVPAMIWDVIRGEEMPRPAPWCRYRPLASLPDLNSLILPAAFETQLAQVPALLQAGKARAVVVRGTPGSEREQTLAGLARALGMNLVVVPHPASLDTISWQQLGPFCAMSRAMPVLRYDLTPGETAEVPSLPEFEGPVGIVLGQVGGVSGDSVEQAVSLSLPPPDAALRERAWQAALDGFAVEELEVISERFHLPTGYIRQVAGLAVAEAGLQQRSAVGMAEVQRASRSLNRQRLDTLAEHIEAGGGWDHLVVSDVVAAKLRELERRCRHRERLLAHLGPAFGASANRGVRALFSGASGTGKTLAARILAAQLGMDLYRVDLAAVVNKYIGETEKNLHRVLSTAEALDVILLLDEGDALLGNRTEVRSSNDRYANLETNYLLQRLEHYQGILLITSNASENIDSAFQRRLDVVVPFMIPQAAERWHIWQLHLPADHRVDAHTLEEIATRCEMRGGQIRNAALHAILLAVDEGGQVTARHLEEAIRSEYRKAGAHYPLNGHARHREQPGGVDAFLNALV